MIEYITPIEIKKIYDQDWYVLTFKDWKRFVELCGAPSANGWDAQWVKQNVSVRVCFNGRKVPVCLLKNLNPKYAPDTEDEWE